MDLPLWDSLLLPLLGSSPVFVLGRRQAAGEREIRDGRSGSRKKRILWFSLGKE
jgi:hypothetical protein